MTRVEVTEDLPREKLCVRPVSAVVKMQHRLSFFFCLKTCFDAPNVELVLEDMLEESRLKETVRHVQELDEEVKERRSAARGNAPTLKMRQEGFHCGLREC